MHTKFQASRFNNKKKYRIVADPFNVLGWTAITIGPLVLCKFCVNLWACHWYWFIYYSGGLFKQFFRCSYYLVICVSICFNVNLSVLWKKVFYVNYLQITACCEHFQIVTCCAFFSMGDTYNGSRRGWKREKPEQSNKRIRKSWTIFSLNVQSLPSLCENK